MSVKLIIKDEDCELDQSKFFGEILLPEKWLMENVFSPDEMFLCQINLENLYEKVGKTYLPERGMLYFFIDYKKKPLPVVRYCDEDVDAYTCFNEDWEGDYDVFTEWALDYELYNQSDKNAEKTGNGFTLYKGAEEEFSEMLCKEDFLSDDEIVLLKFAPNTSEIDFMSYEEKSVYFIIKIEDLKKQDFSNVTLKMI